MFLLIWLQKINLGDIADDPPRLSIHPLKASLSSILVVILVGLINLDATNSFVEAIDGEGIQVIGFVGFNIFADAISLVETRWVLQRGATAGVMKLLGWLAIDLILSGTIFFLLPLALWEVRAFSEAILFKGERPWFGILFWSTFSTSVAFYVFVISALLLKLFHAAIRATRSMVVSRVVCKLREGRVLPVAIEMAEDPEDDTIDAG